MRMLKPTERLRFHIINSYKACSVSYFHEAMNLFFLLLFVCLLMDFSQDKLRNSYLGCLLFLKQELQYCSFLTSMFAKTEAIVLALRKRSFSL